MKADATLRNWINLCGMKWKRSVDGGFDVASPNYWVVRVMLSSLAGDRFARFFREIENCKHEMIAATAAAIRVKAKERYNSKTLSHEMRYVNIIGGYQVSENKWSESIELACQWLDEVDFGIHAFITGHSSRGHWAFIIGHSSLSAFITGHS